MLKSIERATRVEKGAFEKYHTLERLEFLGRHILATRAPHSNVKQLRAASKGIDEVSLLIDSLDSVLIKSKVWSDGCQNDITNGRSDARWS
jgi:hypothetical protein